VYWEATASQKKRQGGAEEKWQHQGSVWKTGKRGPESRNCSTNMVKNRKPPSAAVGGGNGGAIGGPKGKAVRCTGSTAPGRNVSKIRKTGRRKWRGKKGHSARRWGKRTTQTKLENEAGKTPTGKCGSITEDGKSKKGTPGRKKKNKRVLDCMGGATLERQRRKKKAEHPKMVAEGKQKINNFQTRTIKGGQKIQVFGGGMACIGKITLNGDIRGKGNKRGNVKKEEGGGCRSKKKMIRGVQVANKKKGHL